jgi:flagellar hook-associated protein 3 FlgL
MSISGVGPGNPPAVQSMLNLQNQLDQLSQELGTNQKSTTYSGLGSQSGVTVELDAQLAAINGYSNAITDVGTSLTIGQTALQQIASAGTSVLDSINQEGSFAIDNTGQTQVQESAASQLDTILSTLNTEAGNQYLFSGTAVTQPPVATADQILNGNGAQAGLEQVIAERNQADLGADGLGRLVIPAAAGSTVSISEDVAGSPFGFKLASVSSSLTGATVTGPAGSPAAISIDLGATNPNNGDSITFTFNLPDGTTQTLTLQATSAATPGTDQFSIGATPAATAANLQAALTTAVGQLAQTSLSAASAVAAANNFFSDPPQLVSGPPYSTATALVNGTSANTVIWYTGDNSSIPARSTATAQVGPGTTVSYGMRANEPALTSIVESVAVLAATSYSPTDPNAAASYADLTQRVATALSGPPGTQTVSDIEADLANAQTTIQTAQTNNQQSQDTLNDMLQQIEGVSDAQVGSQILQVQNSLEASMATVARLSQISLVNYLPTSP